jgi:hypothetical protein
MRDTMKSFLFFGSSILLVLLMYACGGGDGKGNAGTTQHTWTKTFGGQYDDWGYSVQQTSDGGYIIVGYTGLFNPERVWGQSDSYLIKTDLYGNMVWEKTFSEAGRSVQQTSDGGYIIVGSVDDDGYSNVFFLKTDQNGNGVWEKTFGESGSHENGNFVQQTSDGGYIIVGTRGMVEVDANVYLIKTDSEGKAVWERTFDNSGANQIGNSVQQTSDGGYIIAGHKNTGIYGEYSDAYLIKTDSKGITVWEKTFGGPHGEWHFSVRQTKDGGYILSGTTFTDYSNVAILLVKTDSEGNAAWERIIGGKDEFESLQGGRFGKSVQQTKDGGYIITGTIGSYFFGPPVDVYLIKTDKGGNAIWKKRLGGTGSDGGESVQQTTDGGYIIVGWTSSFGAGGSDVYLIKTDSQGNTQ